VEREIFLQWACLTIKALPNIIDERRFVILCCGIRQEETESTQGKEKSD